MASLYKKDRSPFWYVQFVDKNGKRRNQSTGYRWSSQKETADAQHLKAKLEVTETKTATIASSDAWDKWVVKFLKQHCQSSKTLERYLDAWKWLALYLQLNQVHYPAKVNYKLCKDYIEWRTNFKKKTGKTVCKNTALFEIKTFGLILGEAARLGIIDTNPCVKIGIKKDKPREKPELTDSEIQKIRKALVSEPEWMGVAFEIALHTGCRLRETELPLRYVDFANKTMTFPTPKGGAQKAFSIPIPTAILPLLKKLSTEGATKTLSFPFQPSRQWTLFFNRVDMSHLCFHCLRVTFVTRLARASVPLSVAMRLVNHSSELVHRVYQRLGVEDLRKYSEVISIPSAIDAKG